MIAGKKDARVSLMSVSIRAKELASKVSRGDVRAIARAMSLCENDPEFSAQISKILYPDTGKAKVIGITGAPGSGKSTLVDAIAIEYRKQGKKVGVVAVDPSSPFTGGAVLGDRIRMSLAAEEDNIFIRSIATRGALGGLAVAAFDAVNILDAAGFDIILIETVGVGQAEVDVVRLAHCCLVVMVPGLGDGVQAIKAGVLEIADLFIVNKADKDGADLVARDLSNMLSLVEREKNEWRPKIQKTVAVKSEGICELLIEIQNYQQWLKESGQFEQRRRVIIREAILQRVKFIALKRASEQVKLESLIEDCFRRKLSPAQAANKLLQN